MPTAKTTWGADALVVFVAVLLVALLVAASDRWRHGIKPSSGGAFGGAPRRARPLPRSLVVDALNLTHWMDSREKKPPAPGAPVIGVAAVAAMIDRTAPSLARAFPDRLIYVVKDRDTVFNDEGARAVYHAAAVRNRATVAVVERYEDPPGPPNRAAGGHSAQGRDDLYMGILAHRLRAPVLTADRFRDFGEFRETVPPFHVVEYAHWRIGPPHREYIRPGSTAYARLRAPRTIHPQDLAL